MSKRFRSGEVEFAMRRLSIVLALALAGCSSTYDRPQDQPYGGPYRRAAVRDVGPMLLDIVPDDVWWRDVALVEPLNLTNDQLAALDKIDNQQRDGIARLERDLPVATRDFRNILQTQTPAAADITAAANRVRDLRTSLFDRQVQMLTAERLVLTDQQWTKLLDELQQRRQQRMNRDEGGYRGGRGGYPRGGRGRPWPY
jgi:Spy/CpxP family protein refolding chaperone